MVSSLGRGWEDETSDSTRRGACHVQRQRQWESKGREGNRRYQDIRQDWRQIRKEEELTGEYGSNDEQQQTGRNCFFVGDLFGRVQSVLGRVCFGWRETSQVRDGSQMTCIDYLARALVSTFHDPNPKQTRRVLLEVALGTTALYLSCAAERGPPGALYFSGSPLWPTGLSTTKKTPPCHGPAVY